MVSSNNSPHKEFANTAIKTMAVIMAIFSMCAHLFITIS